MNLKEKIGVVLSYLMQVLIFVSVGFAFYYGNYGAVVVGVISLVIISMPLFLKRKWNITLPWSLNFLIVLSLFLYQGGLVWDLYRSLHPYFYDKIGHFVGSITMALLGFTSVLIIDRYTKVELTNKSIIFFVVIFTLAVGTLWEIGEFTSDNFLGTNAQYDGLTGTMYDLILDLFGGIVAGLIAYFKLRKGKEKFIDQLLRVMSLRRIKQ